MIFFAKDEDGEQLMVVEEIIHVRRHESGGTVILFRNGQQRQVQMSVAEWEELRERMEKA